MPRGARGTTTTAAAPVVDASVLEPIARAALEEITPATTIGALRDVTVADDVATVRFATRQGGYLGWFWTVSLAVNPGLEPSVLETELMPGEGALTAPDWVPWSDRLEDYLAQQAADAESEGDDDADGDGDDDHDHDHDEHDLHGDDGDDVFDGVDIDAHDDTVDDDSDADEYPGIEQYAIRAELERALKRSERQQEEAQRHLVQEEARLP